MGSRIIFCSGEKLGNGAGELGSVLMKNFFYTLANSQNIPDLIILMNSGVRLSCIEEVVSSLNRLEERGVKILACGTCLDYYGLQTAIRAGEVSNMERITEELTAAEQVVTL